MRLEDDEGTGAFLSGFYEIVLTFARLIPYNSSTRKSLYSL